MTTKLFRLAACLLTIVTLGCLTGCKDDPTTVDGTPSIEIRQTDAGETSIKFTLVPKNATSYAYACVPLEDYQNNNYTLTTVNNGDTAEYTFEELAYSSPYMAVAIAYNGSVESEMAKTRIQTETRKPTLDIAEIVTKENTATITVKVSDEATDIMYACYTQEEADYYTENIPDPNLPDWKKWVTFEGDIKPEGTAITLTELENTDYIIEAYSMANIVKSDAATKTFTISYYTTPYVDVKLISAATSNDAILSLKMNTLCSQYYVGMALLDDYRATKVFETVKTKGDLILHKENYEGSVRELVKETFTEWTPETTVLLWILPCDLDGNYLTDGKEDLNKIIKVPIEIPKISYAYGGVGTVATSDTTVDFDRIKTTLTPSNCETFYYLFGTKAGLENQFGSNDQILVEAPDGLLSQPANTEAVKITKSGLLPGTEYMFCAVGVDKNGKIGAILRETFTTKALEFNGAAEVTVKEGGVITTESSVEITINKNPVCTKIKYVFIDYTKFMNEYNGLFEKVYAQMALGTDKNSKDLALTQDATTLSFNGLSERTKYLLFVVPYDAEGKFGKIPLTSNNEQKELVVCDTKELVLNGEVLASVENYTETPTAFRGKKVTFTIQPQAGCKGIYYRFMDKAEVDKLYTTPKKLAAEIKNNIAAGKTVYLKGRPAGTDVSSKDVSIELSVNTYFYMMCVDADGKISDPTLSQKTILMNN